MKRSTESYSGNYRDRGNVDIQQAADGLLRHQSVILARNRRFHPVVAKYQSVLWISPLDAGEFRVWRARYRCDRRRRCVALCSAQHDTALVAYRLLRAGRPTGDVVRSHGIADELGVGRSPAPDKVFQ